MGTYIVGWQGLVQLGVLGFTKVYGSQVSYAQIKFPNDENKEHTIITNEHKV